MVAILERLTQAQERQEIQLQRQTQDNAIQARQDEFQRQQLEIQRQQAATRSSILSF
jgi:hypothetical protein